MTTILPTRRRDEEDPQTPSYRPLSLAPSYHTVDIRAPPPPESRERRPGFAGRIRNALTLKREPRPPEQQSRSTPIVQPTLLAKARRAIEKNDEALFRTLLATGLNVNGLLRDGSRLLHLASDLGRTQIVIELLKHHAKASELDRNGSTPLHVASKNDHATVVKKLIAAGADMYTGEPRPLQLAAEKGHELTTIALLEAWDSNDESSQGHYHLTRALDCAAENGHRKLFVLIYNTASAKLANPLTLFHFERHVLRLAVEHSWSGIVKRALKALSSFREDESIPILNEPALRASLLASATKSGDADTVHLLIHAGCDANTPIPSPPSGKEIPPLRLAVQNRYTEVARVLLDHGADIDNCDEYGRTMLHIAMLTGPAALVILLVDRDADIHRSDAFGFVPSCRARNFWGTDVQAAFGASLERGEARRRKYQRLMRET
ncbi:ankyrin repeat domain-containing protein [Aspergillus stella-maris]|uniref:ankyrin repeat domain-containing protein n=1 Tax=Aspergillus stella-maris TaxID=1810926 RepID=UPI003CCE3AA0